MAIGVSATTIVDSVLKQLRLLPSWLLPCLQPLKVLLKLLLHLIAPSLFQVGFRWSHRFASCALSTPGRAPSRFGGAFARLLPRGGHRFLHLQCSIHGQVSELSFPLCFRGRGSLEFAHVTSSSSTWSPQWRLISCPGCIHSAVVCSCPADSSNLGQHLNLVEARQSLCGCSWSRGAVGSCRSGRSSWCSLHVWLVLSRRRNFELWLRSHEIKAFAASDL